ncbi:MAG: DNA polymerase III subunit gamma/tau [Patescibacteria group bacterium]|nr:DNA polymerase III subunit gamma/tau [bacterium]MDZ4240771.1 DNA polymerase III subunit gamma/tau [Patescibacteria group bacterium]
MSHTVLYRKYRPQKFPDVIGQDHIVKVLEGSAREGNISHAYLFSGSRGTGKTSVARIFADAIGCKGNDLYEIDAASNRGIDDIRQIRESVLGMPFESKFKVYIVDEVHMLTKEAFNALLKTLEEPPAYVVFILATTEMDKLPETVVSRCQTFQFKKPNQQILKKMILDVAKGEKFALEPSSADLIAMLGDGSFRDALGILEKVIVSSSDKKISVKEVELVTGAPKTALINDFITSIVEKDMKKGLTAVREGAENNIDPKVFLKLVLRSVRYVLLLRYAPEMEQDIAGEVSDETFEFLKKLSGNKDANISGETLRTLLTAYSEAGKTAIPELPLELALVKIIGQAG